MSHKINLNLSFIDNKKHGLSIVCSSESRYIVFSGTKIFYNFIGQDETKFSKEYVRSWYCPRIGTVLNNTFKYLGAGIWESPFPKDKLEQYASDYKVTYVPPQVGDWLLSGCYVFKVESQYVHYQNYLGVVVMSPINQCYSFVLPKYIKPGYECEQGVLGEDYVWRNKNGEVVPPELLRPYSKPKEVWAEPGQEVIDEKGNVHIVVEKVKIEKGGEFALYKPKAGDIVFLKTGQLSVLPPDFSGELPENCLPISRPVSY